ncbi:hypothetical protein [Klebsiella variicola]|uniref:hypothetical protein n=2 Tax=Klebsiella variicola TaxID=244366 RepID=UPI0028B97AAC|nr:hypothetical protein [Klebsiella variicola]MDT7003855.1 hypothetical protein [Klebsiella variicola]MDT7028314.1 hypothetical protein [Klebsiella variicola]
MKKLLSLVLATCMFIPGVSPALDLPFFVGRFDLNAKAGLDADTIRLLDGYPKEVKEQALQLVKDALPLLDKSVNSYLDRINEILIEQQTMMICTSAGIVGTSVDQALERFPFLKGSTPLENLEKRWSEVEKKFTDQTTAHEYMIKYADFIYSVGLAKCKIQVTPSLQPVVDRMLAKYNSRFSIWVSLDLICSTASDCFENIYNETYAYLIKSDPRDVAYNDAINKLKDVKPPRKQYFSPFNYSRYEDIFFEMNRILLSVALTKQLRLIKEAQVSYLNQLEKELLTYTDNLESLKKDYNPKLYNEAGYNSIISMANEIMSGIDSTKNKFATAETSNDYMVDFKNKKIDACSTLKQGVNNFIDVVKKDKASYLFGVFKRQFPIGKGMKFY